MIKLLHVVAIGALISSATYAYSIKYDTLLHGEQLAKLKQQSLKEREAIAVLKAEWQHINRPDRLQVLSERHLHLQPLAATQLVRFADIPNRGPKSDDIGKKLEALGLMGDTTPTASLPKPATPRPALAKPVTAKPAPPKLATPRPVAAKPVTPKPAAAATVTARPAPQKPMMLGPASGNVLRPPGRVEQRAAVAATPQRPLPRPQ